MTETSLLEDIAALYERIHAERSTQADESVRENVVGIKQEAAQFNALEGAIEGLASFGKAQRSLERPPSRRA